MNNEIEKKIQEKNLSAPRITIEDIEGVIVGEKYHLFEGTTFTSCLLTLKNGFNVYGESACDAPENFDTEIGMELAKRNAVSKIWSLEEYARLNLIMEERKKNNSSHVDRMRDELYELNEKIIKIQSVLDGSSITSKMNEEQIILLGSQLYKMLGYAEILSNRIELS